MPSIANFRYSSTLTFLFACAVVIPVSSDAAISDVVRLPIPVGAAATLLDTVNESLPPNNAPGLPIPAGSTLIDVSDSGKQFLFSSMDPNVVANQETIPATTNLYWLDISQGLNKAQVRLVTHFAGSINASTGFVGIGNGLVEPFEPLTADLSSDGYTVVFDSRVNAHDYDASVPAENDQPTMAAFFDLYTQELEVPGTIDVFTWSAKALDPANNITAVSLLNARGKAKAVEAQPQPTDMPGPNPNAPMVVGIFQEYRILHDIQNPPPELFTRGFEFDILTENKGISQRGDRVLYACVLPAGWIDSKRPLIKDNEPSLIDAPFTELTTDGFLVSHRSVNPGAANVESAGRTNTVTLNKHRNALGNIHNQLPNPEPYPGNGVYLNNEIFSAEFLQLSGDGNRVVYSTRQTGANLIEGVLDSNISQDVFTHDVRLAKNILVSRTDGEPNKAAGYAQADYDVNVYIYGGTYEFLDSMNHSVSNDGDIIAMTSSAGSLVKDLVNNNVELTERIAIFPDSGVRIQLIQQNPYDIYAFKISEGKTLLINTPNGIANTNLNASFDGMSSDGKHLLFSTAANNFYEPPFQDPHYPPFAGGPLDPNFLLGGFNNLWERDIEKHQSSLVSTSDDGKSSGNQLVTPAPVPAGARETLSNISSSGRLVLFSSGSNNLVSGIYDPGFKGGVFLRDMSKGKTTLMSASASANVPSSGLFTETAISTDDEQGYARVFMGGTQAVDMQTEWRNEDIPSLTPHIYAIEYPRLSLPSSATNHAIVAMTGEFDFNRVFEYRGARRTIKASPGSIFEDFYAAARVATGDVNGDGVVDYIYGAGPNYKPLVVIRDGKTNAEINRFLAFSPMFTGGIYVGAGDVDRDGFADVLVSSGPGMRATVNLFSGRRGYQLPSPALGLVNTNGIRVAGGDINGDGYADILIGSGEQQAGEVRAYSGKAVIEESDNPLLRVINVGDTESLVPTGIYVAAADMTGDGIADIVTGSDVAPAVRIFDGLTGQLMQNPLDLGSRYAGGIRVAARGGLLIAANGPGKPPLMKILKRSYSGRWKLLDTIAPNGTPTLYGPYKTVNGLFVG